jgi:hypothetical protein
MAEARPELQVFLDAVLDNRADWQDFPGFLGSRPWAADWLELERAARKLGLDPGVSKGRSNDISGCVVCGTSLEGIGAATCGECGRRWVCHDCLSWVDSLDHYLCPLCVEDWKYLRAQQLSQPLTHRPLSRLRDG